MDQFNFGNSELIHKFIAYNAARRILNLDKCPDDKLLALKNNMDYRVRIIHTSIPQCYFFSTQLITVPPI